MKSKILNLLLVITSLIGYLEWGTDSSTFLFQAEYDVFKGLFTNFESVAHPFTFIPLIGQILLLMTILQKEPGKVLTYVGIACVGLLLGFMFFIGMISFNLKVLGSTIPFFFTVVLVIRNFRKK